VPEDLVWWSAARTAKALRAKEISAREVMAAALGQIEWVNASVNALVTVVDPNDLVAQAGAADEALARGAECGPLHGLPLAVKDTEPTAGLRTTWGSPLFAEHVPALDSPLVAREKAAGAIVVGKSNVPEFAAGSHTFNTVFGVTRNPYDLERSAGGSSGGSAAALACGLVALADGSDLGGSLRNPASFCNVVGFRPSPGLVPSPPGASGVAYLSHGVHGPMGRTVADAALLLEVLSGTTVGPLERDLTGLRVAWCPGFGLPFEPEVRAVVNSARAAFLGLGCRIVDDEPDLTGADEAFQVLRARLLAAELGTTYQAHPEAFKHTLRWNIERGFALSADEVSRGERLTAEVRARVAAFMAEVDVLVLPTVQVLPFPVGTEYPDVVDGEVMETYVDWMRSCSWVSVTGHPAVSVPAGFSAGGLPVGLQIVGRAGADVEVLQVAYGYEQATRVGERRPAVAEVPAPESGHGTITS
jgi:amidase